MSRSFAQTVAVVPHRGATRDGDRTILSSRLSDAKLLPLSALRFAVIYRVSVTGKSAADAMHSSYKLNSAPDSNVERQIDALMAELGGEQGARAWLQAQMDAEREEWNRKNETRRRNCARNAAAYYTRKRRANVHAQEKQHA